MRNRLHGAAFALALLIGPAVAAWAADEAFRLMGKVKSASLEDKATAIEVADRRGSFKVAYADGDPVEIAGLRYAKIAGYKGGPVQLLGRHQAETRDPQRGSTQPAQILQIITIVEGDGFAPPELPKDLADRKVKWFAGKLAVDPNHCILKDGTTGVETNVLIGRERSIVIREPLSRDALAKGKVVLVDGTRADAKTKDVKPKRITVVAPEIPAEELRVIIENP